MRTLAVTQNITVDGAIEMLGDWWEGESQGVDDPVDQLAELNDQAQRSDAFLVGRRTFEDMRGYWPQQTDDRTGVTDHLNQVQKYVVSATMTDPQWERSTVLSGDPIDEVRRLKEMPGRDIVTTGSISLCHALIEAGLVDEYRLFCYPTVQGRGRRLFPDGFEIGGLDLFDAKSFNGGVTYTAYRPA